MRLMLEVKESNKVKTVGPDKDLPKELCDLFAKYHLQMVNNFQPVSMGMQSYLYTLDGPENLNLDRLVKDPSVLGVYPDLVIAPISTSTNTPTGSSDT